jgi:uncharacterized protein YcaQ
VRAVQLDTISVLARSHELVAYARVGAVGRERVESALWGADSATFEYWSHAACVLHLEDWPLYERKRRLVRAKERRWHEVDHDAVRDVRARLAAEGPRSARELGGAKRGGSWWDWSATKVAAEWLLDTGEAVCRTRRGFERVYDLAERAVPAHLREAELDDDACVAALVTSGLAPLGVATASDLAAYHGLPVAAVHAAASDLGIERVRVEGWREPALCAPGALELASRRPRRGAVLLSPFDSLLWDRARTERLFSLRYRLEAYTPPAKRVHGYFAMPVLAGDRLVGLVDPKREGTTLRARRVTLHEAGAARHVAAALRTAAGWVGCEDVAVDAVAPGGARGEVLAHLAAG